MPRNNTLTKTLAILGLVFVWLPILLPVLFSLAFWIAEHHFLFDYLMPAELFPLALGGGLLLFWAAWRARMYQRLIGWGVAGATILLIVSQVLAVVTGLVSGATQPGGLAWAFVLGCLILFILVLLALAVAGIFLVRRLFQPLQQPVGNI